MISTHIKAGCDTPQIVGVFSFRYDAHLVPAMLANIEPLVDGWVCYDDRDGEGVFSNEVRRRRLLLEAARSIGAHWALAIDPDERFEAPLAASIRALVADEGACCYTFALREMYGEQRYRVDGVWGQKRQARLLPLRHGLVVPRDQLHLPWSYFVPAHQLKDTDFNLYHLKMITRPRREARAALYNFLDPERRMQVLGYDYLTDESGAAFEEIPAGRSYEPAHREDGGLWMPRVEPQS
jgi:hypothetical protein